MHGKPLVYLDSAATTLKPQSVIDATSQFYAEKYGTVHRAIYQLSSEATAHYTHVRDQVRDFLNARTSQEIIFTKGTTESINLVAFSFGEAFIRPGDEVLITALEHHSNIVPWQLLCERKGAILKVVPLLQDQLDLETFEQLLSPRVKIVSIAHISNVLGCINPIKTIIDTAHGVGAKVFIDGAQSAPHIPIDVQALGCDFFAFSGHKIYGPTGIGILYGKKEILDQMPPYQSGGDMIQTVSFEKTTFQDPPLRFEAGTPLIAQVMGLGAALDYLEHHSKIAEYEASLIQHAQKLLREIEGVQMLGQNPASLITFHVEGVHPLDLATLLDLKGIALRSGHLCAQPLLKHFGLTSGLRLSVAPYNTLEEIEFFCQTLNELIPTLNPV